MKPIFTLFAVALVATGCYGPTMGTGMFKCVTISEDQGPQRIEKCGEVVDGRLVVHPTIRKSLPYNEFGFAAMCLDRSGWAWLFEKDGRVLDAVDFDNGPDYFEDGLSRIIQEGKVGFINQQGQIVIPAVFQFATQFEGGYALVASDAELVTEGEYSTFKGGRWGVIDTTGKLVVPIEKSREEATRIALERKNPIPTDG